MATRREFLEKTITTSGALLIGPMLMACSEGEEAAASHSKNTDQRYRNAFFEISPENDLSLYLNRSEIGQGVTQSLLAMICNGLNCEPEIINIRPIQLGAHQDNDQFNTSFIGGSQSVRSYWQPVQALVMETMSGLLAAAAKRLDVSVDSLSYHNGIISNTENRQIAFGELIADLDLVADAPSMNYPHKPIDFHPHLKDKVTGTYKYAADEEQPELFASFLQAPIGTQDISIKNQSQLEDQIPGLVSITKLDQGVVVLASNSWSVFKAERLLQVEWQGASLAMNEEAFTHLAKQKIEQRDAVAWASEGAQDLVNSINPATLSAEYYVPYLAHAQMEPAACYVSVDGDHCRFIGPTQNPAEALYFIARTLGLTEQQIDLTVTPSGGSFGRRASQNYIIVAAMIGNMTKRPTRILWSREQETKQDLYRPAAFSSLSYWHDGNGGKGAMNVELATPGVLRYQYPQSVGAGIADRVKTLVKGSTPFYGNHSHLSGKSGQLDGAIRLPYQGFNHQLTHHHLALDVPVGYWRAVGNSINVFSIESFIDEVAKQQGTDPLAYREDLLGQHKRLRHVLARLKALSGWSSGNMQGVALFSGYGSFCGHVVELQKVGQDLKVAKIYCVADCGVVLNPNNVESQVMGATLMGLSSAIGEQVTFIDGEPIQQNFSGYSLLRNQSTPEVVIEVVESNAKPGGVGELALPSVAPAIANAIDAATAQRIRRLPLSEHISLV
ncbi:MAG: molybdopterin-dependent oxidoreductase [Pseudomonadales bacterium]|nr:molybdopterin-dependent oxidoreductase [Pseudomonadales bacterium]